MFKNALVPNILALANGSLDSLSSKFFYRFKTFLSTFFYGFLNLRREFGEIKYLCPSNPIFANLFIRACSSLGVLTRVKQS
jgi:hypothetical protein